jgi:hypothetical protein
MEKSGKKAQQRKFYNLEKGTKNRSLSCANLPER